MADQQTALTNRATVDQGLLDMLPDEWKNTLAGPRIHTTLDTSREEGRLKIFSALQDEAQSCKELINVPLKLKDYLMHGCTRVNPETGEINTFVRTVLFCANGKTIACGSQGVVKSILMYESLMGKGPFKPPVDIVIKARSLQGGRQWYQLDFPKLKTKAADETPTEFVA